MRSKRAYPKKNSHHCEEIPPQQTNDVAHSILLKTDILFNPKSLKLPKWRPFEIWSLGLGHPLYIIYVMLLVRVIIDGTA